MNIKKILTVIGFVILTIPVLAACAPTGTCSPPSGWTNVGTSANLMVPNGETFVQGNIQLYVDEVSGVFLFDEIQTFEACKEAQETIGEKTLEAFIDNSGNIWLSPDTFAYVITGGKP